MFISEIILYTLFAKDHFYLKGQMFLCLFYVTKITSKHLNAYTLPISRSTAFMLVYYKSVKSFYSLTSVIDFDASQKISVIVIVANIVNPVYLLYNGLISQAYFFITAPTASN